MHEHVPGLANCPGNEKSPPCGLRTYTACPTCWSTHVKLHHKVRRIRRRKGPALATTGGSR